MLVKLFGLILINIYVVNTHNINSTIPFEKFKILSDPSSFGKNLLSLLKQNETRFISSKCFQDLWEYATSLIRFEIWAISMFDASEKLPSGLLRGNGGALGELEQCVDLKQNTSVGIIKGKYCLGMFPLVSLEDYPVIMRNEMKPQPKLINLKDMEIALPWAVCLPDSCSPEDFRFVTLTLFQYSDQFCQTLESETTELNLADRSTSILLGVIFGVMVMSTILDVIFKKKYTMTRYFSLTEAITENKPNEIKCLHGLRTITLLFIIGAFKFVMCLLAPISNWLTPALSVVVLISVTLMRHFGSGPIWPYVRDTYIVGPCGKYWWSSLLYVQNYVNPNFTDVCILPTWYLSLDMQLFILSPLLLIPLGRAPKFTIICTLILLFVSILSPFIATWVYNLKAIVIYSIHPVEMNRYLANFLFPLHTRSASWIIGFLLGWILHESKKVSNRKLIKKIFSPLVVTFAWVLTAGLLILCLLISQLYLNEKYNWVTNAFHIALIRPAWSLGISWIIFSCEYGYSGPVNTILSSPMMRAISSISYSTFLVNFIVITILNQQIPKGFIFSIQTFLFTMWSEMAWCLIFGLMLTVSIEKPFIRIFKQLFKIFDRKSEIENDEISIKGGHDKVLN
ncbi:hypothetical protein FQR65_LT12024 [Abscondita terminalis]|nr:hypothetical protein FQR65_LT12024 [Abscondita terminalis]